METAKISKQQEDSAIRKNTAFSYDSAEREAELISDRFKNSSDVKSEMSSRMGVDFSGVRVHSDDAAHQKAQSLDAAAFTRGSDIYMGSESAIQDAGASNNQVLAHELTHTVQQGTAMQQGEGAVSQSAPTGTVQMFPNIFRRKKKAAAAATPAPVPMLPKPAPKPAEPMPELIDKGNGQMDFSNFIEPGKKRIAANSSDWKGEAGKTGIAGYNAYLVKSGFRDNTGNPFMQSSKALKTLMDQRAIDEASNSSVLDNLANDPVKGPELQEEKIKQKGKIWEYIQNETYRNSVNDFSNESLDTVMHHLDDTNVHSALSAQNQILDGAQGQGQYFQNPALRAHILLSNHLLRIQQPGQYSSQASMEQGSIKLDVAKLMGGGYASQIASVSSAMTMLCGEPGFDPNELSDENVQQVLFNIRQEEKDSRLRKHEVFDEAAFDAKPDIASPEVVRKFGKVLAKTMSTLGLGGAGAAAATPDAIAAADPAPAAAITPAAAAAAAPAAIAAVTTPPEAAAAPAAHAVAPPPAPAPAPAPAPLPDIGPPSTPPPALAPLPEIGPPSTPPPALAPLPEIGPPSTPPPALASLPDIGPPSTPPPALASLPEIGPPSTPPPALASLPEIGPPSTPPPALAPLPAIGPPSTPPPALAPLPDIGPPSTPPPALAPLPAPAPPSTPAPAPPIPAPPSTPAPAPPIPAPAPASTSPSIPAPPIPKAGVDSFESIESYINTLREEKSVTAFNDDDLRLYDYYTKEKDKRDNPQPESEAPATSSAPSAPKKKKGFFQKMRSLFSRKK